MQFDQTFFAFVALVIFIGVVLWAGAHKKAGAALDDRAKLIAKELGDARKLREDAEKLLADYKQKKLDAEKEAAEIISAAKSQAKEYADEARKKLAETLARRTKQAEQKITQAQDAAAKDVRAQAADLAIAAASRLIAGQKGNAKLIAESIAAVKTKMN
ncbi:MAG: ATP F0F1 synthase subunit B [Alphaproteobacteria bacterium]|nr:ATP F0F1 synthase subunit B [Alphaproteobacteria bacterium]